MEKEMKTTSNKKGSRLAAVYANILKSVPAWQVQGHPSPQYTTGNVPAHTVLTSGVAKVVKRGHSKPRALEAPYGNAQSQAVGTTGMTKIVKMNKTLQANSVPLRDKSGLIYDMHLITKSAKKGQGFTKPVAPAVPTVKGKKVSKLFSPPAKDVELGKQVKALRKATKPVA
jgi:hypothetical protein